MVPAIHLGTGYSLYFAGQMYSDQKQKEDKSRLVADINTTK